MFSNPNYKTTNCRAADALFVVGCQREKRDSGEQVPISSGDERKQCSQLCLIDFHLSSSAHAWSGTRVATHLPEEHRGMMINVPMPCRLAEFDELAWPSNYAGRRQALDIQKAIYDGWVGH